MSLRRLFSGPLTDQSARLLPGLMLTVMTLSLALADPAWAGGRDINWTSLNLSSDQSDRLEELEDDWKQTYATVFPQIEAERRELKQLLSNPNSDPNKIMQVQSRINQKKMLLHQEAMKVYLKKKDQLNPDQRNRLQQMIGF